MKTKQNYWPLIIFSILVIITISFMMRDNSEVEQPLADNEIILFYGINCPFCEVVDKYVEENQIDELVKFDHMEVYYNKANSALLANKASLCNMPTNSIGVPFLWDGESCYVGDKDIISFFDQEYARLSSETNTEILDEGSEEEPKNIE